MKLPMIRESYFMNILILIGSLILSFFCLLFGLAHLVELNFDGFNLDSAVGTAVCILLCVAGVVFLIITIAAVKGILYKLKKK